MGEKVKVKEKRGRRTSAVVVRDFKISSPLRLSLRWCSASISREQLFHDRTLSMYRFWQDLSCQERCGGELAGDDDVVRRDGVMLVHV
jgi:hypothetical protein